MPLPGVLSLYLLGFGSQSTTQQGIGGYLQKRL
jgi:hypothetical protein